MTGGKAGEAMAALGDEDGLPPGMVRLTLVLLVRPGDAPDLSGPELEELQERHLAHLAAQRASGAMMAAGPLLDQPDERLRGVCLYAVGLEEARSLALADPAVRAGRLAVEAMNWWLQGTDLPIELPGG